MTSKIEVSKKPGGHIRKKSGGKPGYHKPNKSVVERVEDEEMDKILTELKYFKDHIQANKGHNGSKKSGNKDPQSKSRKNKESNNESGDNTTAPSRQASRPRTSRGNRSSSKVARRTTESNEGGHSAMGFQSNKPQHHLLYSNIDNPKHLHNRSLNEVADSPRTKKRKMIKGRMSPNTFLGNHQRHPSAMMNPNSQNTKGKMNLENAKMALLAKNRPQSAKLKKKNVKGDRSKKGSANRQRGQDENEAIIKFTNQPIPSYFKNSNENSQNLIESHMLNYDGNSFDWDEIYRNKLIKKNLGVSKKAENKIYIGANSKIISTNKKVNSKFMMYKRPESKPFKKSTAYEQISYAEANPMHNTSIDSALFRKHSYQIDKKRKTKAISNVMIANKGGKSKHKRSATPSIQGPKQYLASHLHPVD